MPRLCRHQTPRPQRRHDVTFPVVALIMTGRCPHVLLAGGRPVRPDHEADGIPVSIVDGNQQAVRRSELPLVGFFVDGEAGRAEKQVLVAIGDHGGDGGLGGLSIHGTEPKTAEQDVVIVRQAPLDQVGPVSRRQRQPAQKRTVGSVQVVRFVARDFAIAARLPMRGACGA